MQPYQQATEEILRQGELPKKIIQTAASAALSLGGAAIAGRTLAEKALSLVNKYIPENIAIQGLNKIDPRFGKFIKKALENGKSFDEIRDVISEKAREGLEENSEFNEPPKQNRNIIEQYSPELHQYILEEIQNGRSPLEAGALATLGRKGMANFGPIIDKITKQHKAPWSAIIETVYGQQGGQKAQNQPQQQQQSEGNDKWNQIASTLQNLLNS